MRTVFPLAALALCGCTLLGCNPDHSGDTQAPTTPTKAAGPTAVDLNPNVPDAVKKDMKQHTSLPPAAATTGN